MNRGPIDLNADMGEGFGAWTMGDDTALLDVVTSANVACGFHAGDPGVMRQTVRRAAAHGVGIGAHPSFPDLQGFGRRRMEIAPADLAAMIVYQIGALRALAEAEGTRVVHVKPHGALSNMASVDPRLAETVASAIASLDRGLVLLAPACSRLAEAGVAAGLGVAHEIFADRTYMDDGQLTSRGRPDAMVHGVEASLAHVMAMLEAGALISTSGVRLATPIDSICVHGDGPDAVATAKALREGLAAAGWRPTAFGPRFVGRAV